MNEENIKEKLRTSINHLNNRRLKFDIKNFPIEKTVYEIFNIFSKNLKSKLKEVLLELKKRKKNCDICSKNIDTFNPTLLYDVDVNNATFSFIRIEVCCIKCYTIKNFSIFSNKLYKNLDSSSFLNFSSIYEHYYNVNNLEIEQKNILENDINNYFIISILAKNLRWKCSTPHKTFEEFLEYSLNNYKSNQNTGNTKILKKKKKEILKIIPNNGKKKKLNHK
ncbi:conserved Plasmodium protein, unknown function [Plasmodium gallinaceum]|uniref:Uncharacterized protein n=1 Tax=Plasmodium gallinaceum TaxID=5849 RepID=A0A1J1H3R4_PLAGA|nr:conserved Plasmodium protein, unknown function [Plasmodium gallinaceum]CRG98127.1 conserved Plasmodium protein, unknown function [Plasmodium gallinaceum]